MSLFDDLLVIDCASFVAGPAAATVLSDFGARVIKIEPPGEGDSYRKLHTFLPGAPDYYWTLVSRNKESLALDLKQPAARAVLETLIKRADVFITNYPWPVRERLKLCANDIRPLNDRLIYASLTSFGEVGPEKDRPGYDLTAYWARSGLMHAVRSGPDAEPAPSAPTMGDHPTGLGLLSAILMALYRRERTGEGATVSASLLGSGLWANSCLIQASLMGVELPARAPRGQRGAFFEYYQCADGRWFMLAIVNGEKEWPHLAACMDRRAWLDDPRFATPEDRFLNGPELVAGMSAVFAAQAWPYWKQRFIAAGVTHGEIAESRDHTSCEQVAANHMLPAYVDGGGLQTVDSPMHIEGVSKRSPRMAPDIGRDTRAILEECGLSAAEIAALVR